MNKLDADPRYLCFCLARNGRFIVTCVSFFRQPTNSSVLIQFTHWWYDTLVKVRPTLNMIFCLGNIWVILRRNVIYLYIIIIIIIMNYISTRNNFTYTKINYVQNIKRKKDDLPTGRAHTSRQKKEIITWKLF